jgi:hypothetical protein
MLEREAAGSVPRAGCVLPFFSLLAQPKVAVVRRQTDLRAAAVDGSSVVHFVVIAVRDAKRVRVEAAVQVSVVVEVGAEVEAGVGGQVERVAALVRIVEWFGSKNRWWSNIK